MKPSVNGNEIDTYNVRHMAAIAIISAVVLLAAIYCGTRLVHASWALICPQAAAASVETTANSDGTYSIKEEIRLSEAWDALLQAGTDWRKRVVEWARHNPAITIALLVFIPLILYIVFHPPKPGG